MLACSHHIADARLHICPHHHHQQQPHDPPSPSAMTTNTMASGISLISPSSISTPSTSPQIHSLPRQPLPQRQQRPRLTLNTNEVVQPRTWTKGGTSSLRIDTLSAAASPTSRNTLANALVSRASHTPISPSVPSEPSSAHPASAYTTAPSSPLTFARQTRPRLAIDISVHSHLSSATNDDTRPPETSSRTPSTASVLSVTSSDSSSSAESFASAATTVPYKPSHFLKSCLRNSPLPRMSAIVAGSTLGRMPMFPAAKHVAFRSPLDEEIRTTRYTAAHFELIGDEEWWGQEQALNPASSSSLASDAPSPSPTQSKTAEEQTRPHESTTPSLLATAVTDKPLSGGRPSPPTPTISTASNAPQQQQQRRRGTPSSPRTGEKRFSDSEDSDCDGDQRKRHSRHCPSTPVAGRMKKQREWVWTLGRGSDDDDD